MQFDLLTEETAPAGSAKVLAATREKFGRAPNAHAVFAHSPVFYKAYRLTLDLFLEETSLVEVDRHVVLIAASVYHGCAYCVAVHSGFALRKGVSADVVNALRDGLPLEDARLQVLRQTVERLLATDAKLSQEELDAFVGAGYGQEQLLEVILGAGVKMMSNFAGVIAQTPLDDAYESLRWRSSAETGGA